MTMDQFKVSFSWWKNGGGGGGGEDKASVKHVAWG